MTNPYLDTNRIRAALKHFDVNPSRRMGQNFLLDPNALQAIVNAANLDPSDSVVEVGPGLGVLTWELIQHSQHVIAVELDRRLFARLKTEFAQNSQLQIINDDILNVAPTDLAELFSPPSRSYKVVANLPYSITSAALRHFLTDTLRPTRMVVLVQWEVAERITANVGDLSVLAHAIQLYAEPTIVMRVPASSFLPPPAVDSAVLLLDVFPQPRFCPDQPEALLSMIKAAFMHPRKTLSNSFPSGVAAMHMPFTKEIILQALDDAQIARNRRAETVTLEEWSRVWGLLHHER